MGELPLPFRVYVEVFLIVLGGVGLGFLLLIRFLRSFKSGQPIRILRRGLVFLFYGIMAFLACSAFIPCFNPWGETLCHGPRSEKLVALTFDDGPNEPYTSQILDILKGYDVPAAFFVVGKNVERYPGVVERMNREGFLVGNHTWDHRPLVWMRSDEAEKEILGWERAMNGLGTPPAKLFRAPHGWKSPWLVSLLKGRGYRFIGWSRGVWDSDQPGVDILFNRLTKEMTNGEIILLHDGAEARAGVDRSQTVTILPAVIESYRKNGFQFVSLEEFLKRAPR
ncbi:MAG: polysaccharide deacetylase family protein [Deltaproteobacteria bacterium]|nr:polysaccharide deacetylase family protein [Deltaproteobacteria bacterium]